MVSECHSQQAVYSRRCLERTKLDVQRRLRQRADERLCVSAQKRHPALSNRHLLSGVVGHLSTIESGMLSCSGATLCPRVAEPWSILSIRAITNAATDSRTSSPLR